LRYEQWFPAFSAPFGLGPKRSDVRVEAGNLHVSGVPIKLRTLCVNGSSHPDALIASVAPK